MYHFTNNLYFHPIFQVTFLMYMYLIIHSYHTRSSKNLLGSTAQTNTHIFSIKCVDPCIWNFTYRPSQYL